MGKDYSVCVGAAGFGGGVWHSPDGGDTGNRIRDPLPLGSQVKGMAVFPDNPNRILVGSDYSIYRSEDSGATWEKLWSPTDGMPIWSIAIDPQDTDTIFVGIKPAGPFPLEGQQSELGQAFGADGPGVPHRTAIVTTLMVDPKDHRTVWAGVEADGVYRSLDGGDSWTHVQGGVHPDIPGMAISPGEPGRMLASAPCESYATTDVGESWESVVTTDKFVLPHSRGIAFKPDYSNVISSAVGDTAIGSTGDRGGSTLPRWRRDLGDPASAR